MVVHCLVYLDVVISGSLSWYSNSSRGIQIRLVVGKFVLVVFKFVCRLRLKALDSIVGNCCWFSMCIVIFHCIVVIVCSVVIFSVIVLCVWPMWLLIVTGLLSRGQGSEGPATGHFDAGFSWFPCVHEQMLRWYPSCQVATTCFSCSPPRS